MEGTIADYGMIKRKESRLKAGCTPQPNLSASQDASLAECIMS